MTKAIADDNTSPEEADRLWRMFMASSHRNMLPPGFPEIVCLCGSTRFSEAFRRANLEETLAGRIVLTVGCDTKDDGSLFANLSSEEQETTKKRLDALHLRKIDLADSVLILNVGGYIGESTRRELEHARKYGKKIRFLEPEVNHV